MKEIGRLALDTNAVIAYREGISEVCTSIDKADVIILPIYRDSMNFCMAR